METQDDLRAATSEEMAELEQKLVAIGAGSFHLRQIRDAVARLRSEVLGGQGGDLDAAGGPRRIAAGAPGGKPPPRNKPPPPHKKCYKIRNGGNQ